MHVHVAVHVHVHVYTLYMYMYMYAVPACIGADGAEKGGEVVRLCGKTPDENNSVS